MTYIAPKSKTNLGTLHTCIPLIRPSVLSGIELRKMKWGEREGVAVSPHGAEAQGVQKSKVVVGFLGKGEVSPLPPHQQEI